MNVRVHVHVRVFVLAFVCGLAGAGCKESSSGVDGGEDLVRVVDFAGVDLLPGSCVTACDCPGGADCLANKTCGSLSVQVVCCSRACPAINLCRFEHGAYSQCNNAGAGLFTLDGGAGETCGDYYCNNADICRVICGSANASCIGAADGILGRCAP